LINPLLSIFAKMIGATGVMIGSVSLPIGWPGFC
jgi:hypothetical protein